MNMDLPTVSVTLGPEWASMLDTALNDVVDAHDHTSGKGVQIPTAGLLLDADLPLNGYNLTLTRSVRLSNQGAALALATDLGCIYRAGSELYYNDGNGTAVQITSNGSVNAGAGSIGGLPSGTASVAFNSSTGTYTFQQATNEAAILDGGPVIIRDTAASANGITVQSPTALAADYDLTLFASLPASTSFVSLSTAGVLAAGPAVSAGIDTTNLANGAVTRAKMEAVGQQVSSSTATFSTTSTSYTDVTNATVSITTTGRPVIIACVPDGTTDDASFKIDTAGNNYMRLRINVTGSATTTIGYTELRATIGEWAPSSVFTMYVPAAGTYTFQLQVLVQAGATAQVRYMQLIAYEL